MKRVRKTIIGIIAAFAMILEAVLPVKAMTVYESDGVFHEEGYIFVGESHSVAASSAASLKPELAFGGGISYNWKKDSSRAVTEDGDPNTFTMKGNLFFVFEGNDRETEGQRQVDYRYIYSDGAGNRGRAVEKIHEIININPNIAHWNIISMHGAVSASKGTKEISDYYVNSYRNWIAYEFPQADCYFLSIATMTKFYRAVADKAVFNDTLKAAFPDRFFDYTDFYASRSPQRMVDAIHWDQDTYYDLIVDVIGRIAQKRLEAQNVAPDAALPETDAAVPVSAEYTIADAVAVLYTNDTTVIYSEPSLESAVVLSSCEAGTPIQVTGITSNGFFCVCVSPDGAQSFIAGSGLSQQP